MTRKSFIITISVFLGIIFFLLLFTFQVRQQEVAVVTRFGRAVREEREPGLKWRLPWGIEMVHRLDQRIQNFEDKPSEGLTGDSYSLVTSVYVGWRITDPKVFFPRFAGYAEPILAAERELERMLSHHKVGVIGKHPLSDLVSATDKGANFLAVEKEILTAVTNELRSQSYGLNVEFLGIKKLQIPESVTQTVFDQMTSERKLLADRSQAEGEAEARRIKSGADRRAAETLAMADSEATQIKGKGYTEAAKYLSVFEQSPTLANFLFEIDALEGTLKDRSTLIFDPNTPPFNLFRGGPTIAANTNAVKQPPMTGRQK